MQIDDIGPTVGSFTPSQGPNQRPSGKTLCAAVAPNGQRAYVGGHSGVWRSDDGGATWSHPEWRPTTTGSPTPPGALLPPNVYDLHVHAADADVVFAAASDDVREPPNDGVHRSTDGARTWTRVHQFRDPTGTVGFVGCLAVAPDEPQLLYAAGSTAIAWSADGGDTWTESVPPGAPAVYLVAVGPAGPAGRRVYAGGDRFCYSSDGGTTWQIDPAGPSLGAPGAAVTASARTLAVHPRDDLSVYVMRGDLTLWKGVFPDRVSPAVWTQLPSPPIAGGSDSGCTFVLPHVDPNGTVFLYVSDRRSVHATVPDPTSSFSYSRVDHDVHVDPHGMAFTPDFTPWGPDYDPPTFGRALLVNDGGVEVSTDGTQTWQLGRGLATLNSANVAVNTLPGGATALAFGGGDNAGFSSADGGLTWATLEYVGGDNDCQYADPLQPDRMLVLAPRGAAQSVGENRWYVSADGNPPDTSIHTTVRRSMAAPTTTNAAGNTVRAWNAVSNYCNFGYRPLVLTLHGRPPRPDGDLVTVKWTGIPEQSPAVLMRTTASSSVTAATDWNTTATAEGPGVKVFQVGPVLPDNGIGVVQGGGGHDAPTFYVSNLNRFGAAGSIGGSVWSLEPGETAWRPIVPHVGAGAGPAHAHRFFIDPYRPRRVYVLSDDAVWRSDNGGTSWIRDEALDRAVTEDGAFPRGNLASPNPGESVLRDMQFDPVDPYYRLALGVAGVFLTRDGLNWSPLLRSSAVALQPTSMVYDPMACVRTLYIGTMGRGLLRLSPLPPDWEFPVGSLQGARGRITLLRVHDVGTAYGPPYDRLDTEVVITLDTEPEKAFGLQLRTDGNGPAAAGMLTVLRDCFNRDRPVRIDFVRSGCRTGTIIRAIEDF